MSLPERTSEPVRHVPRALEGGAPTALEYAIIAVLIAAVAVGTWKTFGEPQLGDPQLGEPQLGEPQLGGPGVAEPAR